MSQGRYKHTMEDIEQRTGLSRHFLYRCNSKLCAILEPFRTRGDNNQVLFDDSGLTVFDWIKQYKEDGQNLTQIREVLEGHLQNRSQTGSKTSQDSLQILQSNEGEGSAIRSETDPASHAQVFIEEIRRMQREHQDEKDKQNEETKHALKGQIEALKAQVKLLLPDGRTMEDLQREREEAVRNKVKAERLQKDREAEKGRREQRRALLSELARLERKWGKGKRRRQIINQLRHFETEG